MAKRRYSNHGIAHTLHSAYRVGKRTIDRYRAKSASRKKTKMPVRVNNARSLTKTKTKTKKMDTKEAEIHSGVSTNTYHLKLANPHKSIGADATGRWTVEMTNRRVLTDTSGKQAIFDFSGTGTIDNFITSTGAAYDPFQSATQWFGLNPNQLTTGSNLLTGGQPLEDKIGCLSYKESFYCTNLDNYATKWTIYVLTPRSYTAVHGDTAWTAGYANEAFGLPAGTAATAGYAAAGTLGYMAPGMVGAQPTDSPIFRKLWKILKVVTYEMAGGASQEVHFDIAVNHILKKDLLKSKFDASERYIPNNTVMFMMTARGQVVEDQTPTRPVDLTFASTRLGIIRVGKVKLCGVKNAAAKLNTNVASYQISAGVGNPNQIAVNILDVAAGLVQA